MTKIIHILLFVFFCLQNSNAQDARAKKILETLSNETKKQTNSSIYQLSLMNENYFHFGNNSLLKIIGIYQKKICQTKKNICKK